MFSCRSGVCNIFGKRGWTFGDDDIPSLSSSQKQVYGAWLWRQSLLPSLPCTGHLPKLAEFLCTKSHLPAGDQASWKRQVNFYLPPSLLPGPDGPTQIYTSYFTGIGPRQCVRPRKWSAGEICLHPCPNPSPLPTYLNLWLLYGVPLTVSELPAFATSSCIPQTIREMAAMADCGPSISHG